MTELIITSARVLTIIGGNVATVSADILLRIITLTTSGILDLTKSLFLSSFYPDRTDYKQLENIETELDLIETVRIYDSYLKEYIERHRDYIDSSPTVHLTIVSVQSVLEDIHKTLKSIDERIKSHKDIWFSSWRTLDFTREAHYLRGRKRLLDTRMHIFLDLFKDTK